MVREVYSKDRPGVSKALAAINSTNIRRFSNMPNNVVRAAFSADEHNSEEELMSRNEGGLEISLLSHLGNKYPHYYFFVETKLRFFEDDQKYHDTMLRTYVFKGEEPLGLIESGEVYDKQKAVVLKNNRISEAMSRCQYKTTTKLSEAKSIFAKYFYGVTMLEHMENTAHDIWYEINNTVLEIDRRIHNAEKEVAEFIKTEIAHGNQSVIQFLLELGKGELMDTITHSKDDRCVVKNIQKVILDKGGYYVMFQGQDYFKWPATGDSTPKRFNRDEMPDDMRAALGLLKIAEKGTFVDGAGFKLADDKFFIRNEVKLEFDDR